MRLWLSLHLLGMALWLGGAAALLLAGRRAPGEDRRAAGVIARMQAGLMLSLVGPSALLTTLAGLMLTFKTTGATGELAASATPLYAMQGAGLVSALVTLFVGIPTAARFGRLDPEGKYAELFDELRRRLTLVVALSGALALVALIAGAALRY